MSPSECTLTWDLERTYQRTEGKTASQGWSKQVSAVFSPVTLSPALRSFTLPPLQNSMRSKTMPTPSVMTDHSRSLTLHSPHSSVLEAKWLALRSINLAQSSQSQNQCPLLSLSPECCRASEPCSPFIEDFSFLPKILTQRPQLGSHRLAK